MNKTGLSQAVWSKSSRTSANSHCVEVAFIGEWVATRDSKNPAGPALIVSHGEWDAFVSGVDNSEFKRP